MKLPFPSYQLAEHIAIFFISCFNSFFSVTASVLVLSRENFKFFNKVNALNYIP